MISYDMKKLTTKQQRFVDFYDGNGTEACRKAGYKGDDNSLGAQANRLLRNVKIKEAIKQREEKRTRKDIATREERQKFWTGMMNDEEATETARLRASELLGKSEADFVEKREIDIDTNINIGVIRLPALKPEGAEIEVFPEKPLEIVDGLDTEPGRTDRDTTAE